MQNASLDDINPSNLKNFFKELCILSSRHENKGKITGTVEERKFQSRIYQLENELQKAKEERDNALGENKNRINELNDALVSIKTMIHELLEAKKHRIRHLERKIREEVKI